MTFLIPHEQICDTEDRSWTLALVDELRSASASDAERDEAVGTLACLEDYRSLSPLTAMLEDRDLPESVRGAASQVLLGFDDSTTGERRRSWWEGGDSVEMEHALRLMERSEADVIVAVAGDDRHPLQRVALLEMAFDFDEVKHQAVKIRALAHPGADVRDAAASVLMWDEPVAAEEPLVSAASDPSRDVAASAVSTLQYYPSRRVLRVLADLAKTADEQVRAEAVKSFDENVNRFEYLATYGDPEQVTRLREWMEPVADLVGWPDDVEDREAYSPSGEPSRIAMSESELLALLADRDGEWRPKKETLRQVAWERYAAGDGRGCVRRSPCIPIRSCGRSQPSPSGPGRAATSCSRSPLTRASWSASRPCTASGWSLETRLSLKSRGITCLPLVAPRRMRPCKPTWPTRMLGKRRSASASWLGLTVERQSEPTRSCVSLISAR